MGNMRHPSNSILSHAEEFFSGKSPRNVDDDSRSLFFSLSDKDQNFAPLQLKNAEQNFMKQFGSVPKRVCGRVPHRLEIKFRESPPLNISIRLFVTSSTLRPIKTLDASRRKQKLRGV